MSSHHGSGHLTRRNLLVGLGTGLVGVGSASLVYESGAFSSTTAGRGVDVSTASGSDALLGIVDQGPVKKNSRDPMATFHNNTSGTLSITVSLDNTGDGTLFDNLGNSGSSVTFDVGSGNDHTVDIKASVTGTIPYSVSGSSSSFSIETSGSVESQTGNVTGAVVVDKPSKDNEFTANLTDQQFEVKSVDVRDELAPDNLDKVEFRVREGGTGGTVVGTLDVDNPPADRYNPKGNPAVTVQPDSGYVITIGTTYALTVTGYDTDGNSDSSSVQDVA